MTFLNQCSKSSLPQNYSNHTVAYIFFEMLSFLIYSSDFTSQKVLTAVFMRRYYLNLNCCCRI